MSSLSRWFALALIAVVANLIPQRSVVAQSEMELQPGVVISLASLNEHFGDIEHLMDASGFGQMKGMVRLLSAEYIKGLDLDRPMGALLFFDAEATEPKFMAFVPVEDIEDVLDTLATVGSLEEGDGAYSIEMPDGTVLHIRSDGAYAFVAEEESLLDTLPDNPAAMLEDLPNAYNLAAKVYGQRIPEELRNMAIDGIREGAEESMQNLGDGPEAELQRGNFEYSMKSMESLINETDELVVGFDIDATGKRLFLDIRFVGLPGSHLARQCDALKDAPPTRFGGFLKDDAAINFNMTGTMQKEDLTQFSSMLGQVQTMGEKEIEKARAAGNMSDNEAESLNAALVDLIDVLETNIENGVMDFGGTAMIDENRFDFAMGTLMADGAKLEARLKELSGMVTDRGAPVEFEFDAETRDGVRYHNVNVMIPEGEEEARAMFGESLKLQIGFGDDVMYLSGGSNGAELLDACINGSGSTDGLFMQGNAHLLPLLRFGAQMGQSSEMGIISDMLPEDAADRIRITGQVVENGQQVRLEIEDGIIEILSKIGQAMSGQMGMPPQDF